MVQKGDQENAKDIIENVRKAEESHNLNESISSTLNFSGIYLDRDGDKAMHMNKSPDFLHANDSREPDDLFNCSDNASQASNCSSNSSTTGNLTRNVNLADVELDLEQEEGKPDLIIKVKLKKLKFKNNSVRLNQARSEAKEIYLDFEEAAGSSCTLRIRPLHNAIKEVLSLDQLDKDCLEISCMKALPVNWPSVLEDKGLLADYVMNKFVPYSGRPQSDAVADAERSTNESSSRALGDVYPIDPSIREQCDFAFHPTNYRRLRRGGEFRDPDLAKQLALSGRGNFLFPEASWNLNNWNLIPYNENNANLSQIKAQIGYTGLDNLGNTCFMNAVLQCLSNTDELRDFFLMTDFNSVINKKNPFGSNGRVATGFYSTVTQLWNGKHSSYSPQSFKDFISSKMNKFEGNAQEDSVEFMEIFLDLLHEDLNRVDRTAKIIADPLPKSEDEMTDNELADAMWSRHLQFNDSLIVDYFHGQLKSHLTCSVCAKSSLTFDPFLFLSVPLPKPQITLRIFFFSLDYEKKPLRVSVTCNQDIKCSALLKQISEKFDVTDLRLIVYKDNKDKLVDDDEQVFRYSECDMLVFQVKNEQECGEEVFNIVIKQVRICNGPGYLNGYETCDSEYWSLNDWVPNEPIKDLDHVFPLGRPFMVSLTRSELNYANLCAALKNRARHSVDMNVFSVEIEESLEKAVPGKAVSVGDLENEEESNADSNAESNAESNRESLEEMNDSRIEIKVKPKMVGKKKLHSRVTKVEGDYEQTGFNILYLRTNQITSSISINEGSDFEDLAQKAPSYLYMQWKDDPQSNYRIRINSKDLDYSANYHELLNQINEKNVTSLEDCLRMFTDKEELSLEDSWHCPKCQKPQKASKQLTIWRLPKILIMQLKRFSYKQYSRDKIDNFIEFPLHNLDLKSFVSESNRENLAGRTTYDLYAVINHYGEWISKNSFSNFEV